MGEGEVGACHAAFRWRLGSLVKPRCLRALGQPAPPAWPRLSSWRFAPDVDPDVDASRPGLRRGELLQTGRSQTPAVGQELPEACGRFQEPHWGGALSRSFGSIALQAYGRVGVHSVALCVLSDPGRACRMAGRDSFRWATSSCSSRCTAGEGSTSLRPGHKQVFDSDLTQVSIRRAPRIAGGRYRPQRFPRPV